MELRPMPPIYKSQGSLQIKYIKGIQKKDASGNDVSKPPTVMLSFCKCTGERSYDTEHPKTIACGYWDVCRIHRAIVKGFPDKIKGKDNNETPGKKLLHRYNDRMTTLTIAPGTEGTYNWSIYQKEGSVGDDKSLGIFCDSDELYGIKIYLDKCIDLLLEDSGDYKESII
jgi:hypothetical protein